MIGDERSIELHGGEEGGNAVEGASYHADHGGEVGLRAAEGVGASAGSVAGFLPEGVNRTCVVITIGVLVGLAVAGAVLAMLLFPAAAGSCSKPDSWRLTNDVVPVGYAVTWEPRFAAPFTFSGTMAVTLAVKEEVSCVYMHSEGLELGDVLVLVNPQHFDPTNVEKSAEMILNVDKSDISVYEDYQMIGIPLGGNRVAKEAQMLIQIGFNGKLSRTMDGLYLSTYNETVDGGAEEERTMVATQFEATFARHAFPCFDEPSFKANFTITIDGVPDGYVALSNMPESTAEETEKLNLLTSATSPPPPSAPQWSVDGTRTVKFDTSVSMSTYLVAVVIGQLKHVQGHTTSGTLVRVWSRPELADRLDFALDTGVKVLPYFETLFDVPFPLPKEDMAAIPDVR